MRTPLFLNRKYRRYTTFNHLYKRKLQIYSRYTRHVYFTNYNYIYILFHIYTTHMPPPTIYSYIYTAADYIFLYICRRRPTIYSYICAAADRLYIPIYMPPPTDYIFLYIYRRRPIIYSYTYTAADRLYILIYIYYIS